MNWPSVGYASIEDVSGYTEHLARLVTDAPPPVAALASIVWDGAKVERWTATGGQLDTALLVRNDEVLDTDQGLWRRWNHARVSLGFRGATTDPSDTAVLDLLGGDVHVLRGELAHAAPDAWELRLLVSPTGEVAITFRDVTVSVTSVSEQEWDALDDRPLHGWRGPFADGWVDWATPVVRAAALGDVGGLSLELQVLGSDSHPDLDALDPRWGFAPLHAAAWFDRVGTAELLLDLGARVDVLDSEGRPPLDLARARQATRLVRLLEAASSTDM